MKTMRGAGRRRGTEKKSSAADLLFKKIRERRAEVAVVGLGYVGLPLAVAFARKGFRVCGVDVDPAKVESLLRGRSYIQDVSAAEVSGAVRRGCLKAVTQYDVFETADVIIVCVPTPLNRAKDPDISFIVNVTAKIRKHLHAGQLVILESTTYPGTTEEVILPALEESGLKAGRDFFLCFSPERVDPGNRKFKTQNIPKVVGGVTPVCTSLAAALYGTVTRQVVPVSSSRTAEMAKLLENTFRIVNIGLVNELARAAESLHVNIWEAIDAARTKPFGYMPFYPGPGIGGHCIGIDPIYLSWKARVHGTDLHFIDLARRINAEMPKYVVHQAAAALNFHRRKSVNASKILVLGISYKRDVSDTRESPALDILHELSRLGARISYHDPYVPSIRHEAMSLKSAELTPAVLRRQDLVILATDHSCFDLGMIVRQSRLIYDTRNSLKKFRSPHIVRL